MSTDARKLLNHRCR